MISLELLTVSLVGALINLDTSLFMITLISQPVFACTILGWMLNDIQAGMHFGYLMQLIWLGNLPVGPSSIPEGNLGSIIGVILFIKLAESYPEFSHLLLVLIILYVVLMSFLGFRLVYWIRVQSNLLLDLVMTQIQKGYTRGLMLINLLSLTANFLLFCIMILVSLVVGEIIIKFVLNIVPESWDNIAIYTEMAMIGIGAGTVFTLYRKRWLQMVISAGILLGLILFYVK